MRQEGCSTSHAAGRRLGVSSLPEICFGKDSFENHKNKLDNKINQA